MRRIVTLVAAVLMAVGLAAPAYAAPSEGNSGKKVVFAGEDLGIPIDCGGTGITLDVDFVVQLRFHENGKFGTIGTFNLELLYYNAAGDTYLFKDRGGDFTYFVDGVEYVAQAGRSSAGNIGRWVLESPFTPDEEIVFQAGQQIGSVDDLACGALT
jgi:hypothetical protein